MRDRVEHPALPSRADVEAEHAHQPLPDPACLTAEDLGKIFNYAHIQSPLTARAMETFLEAHSPEDRAAAEQEPHLPRYAARWWYYQLSLREAARLGFAVHPEFSFSHNPVALIEQARGRDDGEMLANKWGFTPSHIEPGTMWDIMAQRRDGDAIIALIGDDRGWAPDWEYFIAVVWAPAALGRAFCDDEMFAAGLT
jgi:hypothetical protein